MTIDSSRVLSLLDEVGRSRALSSDESDLVEDIVTAEREDFRWSERLDQGLLRAALTSGGIARFARRHSITPSAAYNRLLRLRRQREGRKGARRKRRR
jgi:hypothetical protein